MKTKHFYFLLIFLSACGSKITINTETYNLKGNVKMFSDTQIQCIYNDKWEVEIDTRFMNATSFVNNQFFDEDGKWIKGCLNSTKGTTYFNTEVLYDEKGNYAGTIDKDTNGNVLSENKVTKISKNEINVKTFYSSREASNTSSFYKRGLLEKQITKQVDGSETTEQTYIRDKDGNENEIETKTIVNGNVISTEKLKVKVLEKDSRNNWTSQAYYFIGTNNCILLKRKIEYYD
ncbi:MAG: hypothetical protein GX259_02600 [Bacteroidales bacterium]|nr:hypothetical protein [Bacteroidales bacterium]